MARAHLLADVGPDGTGESLVAGETVELAFLAAIQHLSPQQRAVLILRDVLGWSAKQTSELLELSEAAVKSTLQRARPTMRAHLPDRRDPWGPEDDPTDDERRLLAVYMHAMERQPPVRSSRPSPSTGERPVMRCSGSWRWRCCGSDGGQIAEIIDYELGDWAEAFRLTQVLDD